MKKFMSRALVGAAAAGMVFAPIAAQANTRAAESTPVYSTSVAQPGMARKADGEKLRGGSALLLILALGAAGFGIYTLVDSSDPASPGT
ncbi:MAG: hypothetical protein AAFY07_13290 [Pseudomonadota bacterium]